MIPTFLAVSRPRFWLYTLGPVLIGSAAAIKLDLFFTPIVWLYLFYFLIPANYFIYAINDLSDVDTDAKNPKKRTKEVLYDTQKKNIYLFGITLSLIMSTPLFIFGNMYSSLFLMLFIALGAMYSTPPFRFKSKPFIDFSSNILYALPGFAMYSQLTQSLPSGASIAAAFFWTSAMHLFSAIPDIKVDKEANLMTTAVLIGKTKSLLLCAVFWATSGLVTKSLFLWVLCIPYVVLPLGIHVFKWDIQSVYWKFPYITTVIGGLVFWYLILV